MVLFLIFMLSLFTDKTQKKKNSKEGVIKIVAYEVTDYKGEFANTWVDYFEGTLKRINQVNAKRMDWNSLQLKKELNLEIEPEEIRDELDKLDKAGFIRKAGFKMNYRGHRKTRTTGIFEEDVINIFYS